MFTHIVESGDMFRIAYYSMTSVLNSVLTGQILYYNYVKKEPKEVEMNGAVADSKNGKKVK